MGGLLPRGLLGLLLEVAADPTAGAKGGLEPGGAWLGSDLEGHVTLGMAGKLKDRAAAVTRLYRFLVHVANWEKSLGSTTVAENPIKKPNIAKVTVMRMSSGLRGNSSGVR